MSVLKEEEFAKEYNKLLARLKKAEEYFKNEKIDIEKRCKWTPEYEKIVRNLGKMVKEYEKLTGAKMPMEEMMNGFGKRSD